MAPIRPLLLPEIADDSKWIGGMDGTFCDREKKYVFGYSLYAEPSAHVNHDFIKESDLKSSAQLLDPKFRGKIVIQTPTAGSTHQALGHMAFLYGENFIREFLSKQDVIITDDNRQQVEWVVRGKYPIATNKERSREVGMKPFLMTEGKRQRYVEKKLWGLPTLPEVFEEKAKKHPDKEAFVDSTTRITYAEAERSIDRLALGFVKLGLEKDDVVVIQLPNIVEAAIVRLALPKAGIMAAMVMPAFEAKEVRYILDFTKARGIIIPFRFRNTALNMTSGSTGMPKISECYGANQLLGHAHVERWRLTAADNLGLLIPFPGGIANNFWVAGIIGGCKMAFLEQFEATEAFKFVERERISFLCGVPTVANSMVRAQNLGEGDFDLRSLRIFFLSGAPVTPSLAEEVEQKLGCKVILLLGCVDFGPISETSVDDRPEVRHRSVGRPLSGTEVKVVDERGEEVPIGEHGELLCRGPYSLAAYYKRPELTLDAYGGDKDGWFRTGDQVKLYGDGNLYVTGRLKDIIKRGGMTIVPAEIEHLLRLHRKVLDVAVVSMPDADLGEKACAFVITKGGEKFSFEEMTTFLEEKGMAKFKWPERMEIVNEFPMVSDQKVFKKKLMEIITDKLKTEGKI